MNDGPSVEEFDPSVRAHMTKTLGLMDQILDLAANNNARITEKVFVDRLLPVLVKGDSSLVVWQDLAGNVLRSIDVLDNKTGEFLFTVPAILRQINISSEGKSAYDTVVLASLKRERLPKLGDAEIISGISPKIRHNKVDPGLLLAWNAILKRYGYSPLINVEGGEELREVDKVSGGVTHLADSPAVASYDDL